MQCRFNPNISKLDINELPLFKYEGDIEIIKSSEDLDKALDVISKEGVLGFDTETRPSFKKGTYHQPSLIQLATSNTVYINQFSLVPLDSRLASILSNPHIIKTGVAVQDDVKALRDLFSFTASGMLDLADVAKKNNLKQHGLRGLAGMFLGVRISKSARCSNWSNPELTRQQVNYAATDAWISLKVYSSMEKMNMV